MSKLFKRRDGSWAIPMHRWLTDEGVDRAVMLAALALVGAVMAAMR
jgi:hypothetical protein